MRKRLKVIAGVLIIGAVAIQVYRPSRTNPASAPSASLMARTGVPSDVSAVLVRSCRDCHSNETRWPWYSNVAPVSWWVIDHVNHGRSHFNYSEWSKYKPEEQRDLLQKSCELAKKGEMPLPSYLRMHDAALSPQGVQALCAFTDSVARDPTRR